MTDGFAGRFRVQRIEDRSENQVGWQSGNLVERASFRAFLRHSPCSEQAFERTRL
jgi:hypothetical protein